MKNLVTLASLVGLGLGLGCQQPVDPSPSSDEVEPTSPTVGALVAGAETKIRGTLDPNLAFEQDGTSYRAAYLTHQARITDGALDFTPLHWNGTATIKGAPVTLATAAIDRGDNELVSTISRASLVDGALVLDRGSARERFDQLAEGVEQSWDFAAVPTGAGDLTVHVAVAGYEQVTTTRTGIHFHTPGLLGIVYSNAVWRDANGEAWEVPSRWDGSEIVIKVPENVLDASVFPATLDPTIGPEYAVDTYTTGNTGAFARELSIAFSGSTYLLVWRDDRNSVSSDIYATRVASDGTVLDQYGLAISTGAGTQSTPVVAWVGSKWVVAWNDGGNISAATVTGQGTVTQLGSVAATAALESLPAIASAGTAAVLVWQSDSDVRGAYFNGSSFGSPFDIAATANNEVDPAVAGAPSTGFLVAWSETTTTRDLNAQLLTIGGALNGTPFAISAAPGDQLEPAAAFNGTDYVVTWTDRSDIYGSRVSTTGTVLDSHLESMVSYGGVPISVAAAQQVASAVSCSAVSCLISWSDRRALSTNGADIFGQIVDATMVLQGTEIAIGTAQRNQLMPVVALGGSTWLTAWEDQRTGGASLAMGSRVDATGTVLDTSGIVFNTSRNGQRTPAIATGAGTIGSLAVWSDSRSIGNDIMGLRINASGNALEGFARVISGSAGEQADPAVSFDGSNFLAVWRDGRNPTDDIYAARFNQGTATTLDTAGIAITTAADRQLVPDVASGGGVSLVVWQDRRNGSSTQFDIYGALVNSSGAITVADIVISNASGDQVRPAVTFDPTNSVFVVVWSDQRANGNADIYGARVSTAGTVLDAAGVLISGAANGQFNPDVAASGSQLLVTWDDRRNDSTGDAYAARVTAAGSLSVLDTAGIAIATSGGQSETTVVGTLSGKWAVAWTDTRNAATQRDIYAADISTSGTNLGEFLVSGGAEDEFSPSFQNDPNSGSKVTLVYQKLRADINAQRVYRRLLTYAGEQGVTCSQASQCASGFCVDGYCCDSACGGTQNTYPRDCQACSVARGAAANGTCGVAVAGTLCRWYTGGGTDTYCDVTEKCDGTSTVCPPDVGRNEGKVCTGNCGTGVCPTNDETGAPHVCDCP